MIKNRTNTGKPTDDFIRIQDLWGMFTRNGIGLPLPCSLRWQRHHYIC